MFGGHIHLFSFLESVAFCSNEENLKEKIKQRLHQYFRKFAHQTRLKTLPLPYPSNHSVLIKTMKISLYTAYNNSQGKAGLTLALSRAYKLNGLS